MLLKYFICFSLLLGSGMNAEKPGSRYPPTKGEVWPKPQQERKQNSVFILNPLNFHIKVMNHNCEILSSAVKRYTQIIKNNGVRSKYKPTRRQNVFLELQIYLSASCEDYPSFEMDEKYYLTVSKISTLKSGSIWGVLRGLESFAQLFYRSENTNEIRINATDITDFPRYQHRGLLLDTSRHYISVGNILKLLDAMAINKMNVFHWHIVDDQSFPYESKKFPNLSKKGAFHPSMVYTKKDIDGIVEYARYRGIRVIPEIDVPGHTRSWGEAYPNILTKCYRHQRLIELGPMNPISDATYKLLKDLFEEVQQWFPDKFFHIGGDEVDLNCWESNPELQEYMKRNQINAKGLFTLFMKKAIPLLGNHTTTIVWQEVFDELVPLPSKTIVQVWKNLPVAEMLTVLLAGHRVLFSSMWYLGRLNNEWPDYYKYDPRQMVFKKVPDENLVSNIVGGEACMWGEMIDDRNVISRVWPRASAVAEKLWTSEPLEHSLNTSTTYIPMEVYYRMEEHACRMLRRGIDVQPPTGPGYCVK